MRCCGMHDGLLHGLFAAEFAPLESMLLHRCAALFSVRTCSMRTRRRVRLPHTPAMDSAPRTGFSLVNLGNPLERVWPLLSRQDRKNLRQACRGMRDFAGFVPGITTLTLQGDPEYGVLQQLLDWPRHPASSPPILRHLRIGSDLPFRTDADGTAHWGVLDEGAALDMQAFLDAAMQSERARELLGTVQTLQLQVSGHSI